MASEAKGTSNALLARAISNSKRDLLLVNYPQPFQSPGNHYPFGVLIHDLNWQTFPENFKNPAILDRNCQQWIEDARVVFTVSEFVRSEIVSAYKIDEKKVIAAPLAPFHPRRTTAALPALPTPESPYWIYPAALGIHKGHDILFDAMLCLGSKSPSVVVTCGLPISGESSFQDRLKISMEQLSSRGKLIVKKYVSDNEMETLRIGARGYIIPSRYEGFGLPLAEAISLKKPTIASDIPVFHETAERYSCKENILFFESGSALSLAEAMATADEFGNTEMHACLENWTWADTAKKILEGLSSAIDNIRS